MTRYVVTTKVIITPIDSDGNRQEREQSLSTTRTIEASSIADLGHVFLQIDQIGSIQS